MKQLITAFVSRLKVFFVVFFQFLASLLCCLEPFQREFWLQKFWKCQKQTLGESRAIFFLPENVFLNSNGSSPQSSSMIFDFWDSWIWTNFVLVFFYFCICFLTKVPLCFTVEASAKCQQRTTLCMLMSAVFVPSFPLETCWLGLQPQVPLDPQSCLAASYPACLAPLITVCSALRLAVRVPRLATAQIRRRRQPGFCVATLKSQRRPAWSSPAQQTQHRPHSGLPHQSPAFILFYYLDL